MIEHLKTFWVAIQPNLTDVLLEVLIMVSAVIVLLGVLKKFIFNKIQNKLLRKIVLSILSIALVFGAVAVNFLIEKISFDHYLIYAGFCSVATIIIYWLYENTGLRDGLHKIGSLALSKTWGVFGAFLSKVAEGKKTDIETDLLQGLDNVKASVKKEIPSFIKHDNEIDNL